MDLLCLLQIVCMQEGISHKQAEQAAQAVQAVQAGSKAAGSSGLIVFVMLWHVMTMMIAEKKCISV